MKKFILRDLQSGVEEEYEGYVENSTYYFSSTKDKSSKLTIVDLKDRKAKFTRETKEMTLSSTLEVNKLASLLLNVKELNKSGDFPILVRDIEFDYPNKIMLRYHLLDDKNIPVETCEILVVEKL